MTDTDGQAQGLEGSDRAGIRLASPRERDSGFFRALEGFRTRLAAFGLGTSVRPILAPVGQDAPAAPVSVPASED